MDWRNYREYYERHLPHFQPHGAVVFVTFGLQSAVAKHVPRLRKAHRAASVDLTNPNVATIIANSIQWGDGKQHTLFAFCIMPDHVHMLLQPRDDAYGVPILLAKIMHGIKGATARSINRHLHRQQSCQSKICGHTRSLEMDVYPMQWYSPKRESVHAANTTELGAQRTALLCTQRLSSVVQCAQSYSNRC